MRPFLALYRLGLRLVPRDFRRRYGAEAAALAARRVADARGVSRIRVAARELIDLLGTAIHEHGLDRDRGRTAVAGLPRERWGSSLGHDVRHAWRSLVGAPSFTITALVILTLGIGASTAIFSVVDAVVIRALPFDESDRLVSIGRAPAAHNASLFSQPAPVQSESVQTYLDWRDQQMAFEAIGASTSQQMTLLSDGPRPPEALTARRITASLWQVLRARPAIGRAFSSEDEITGRQFVAIISDGLWRRRFNAAPDVIGRALTTANDTWTIVGVMPPGFAYPVGLEKPVDVWVPYAPTPADRVRSKGKNYFLQVVGRLKPGVSLETARRQMQALHDRLVAADPAWYGGATVVGMAPLRDALVGRVRAWMLLLLGAVSMVLLLACVNVANLMLARATTREREWSVRAALGGTRWRLARGLLVESLLLSALGTIGGIVAARWGVDLLKASMPQGIPRLSDVAVDLRVLAVAAVASTITGVLFGLAPAIQGSRPRLTSALRDGGRGATAGRARQRVRAGLVISEVALAVVLLVGAGLFVTSFIHFSRVDIGIDTRGILTLETYINSRDPARFEKGPAFVSDVAERLRHLPGVDEVAATAESVPLTGSWARMMMSVPDRPDFDDTRGAVRRSVTDNYFHLLGISLVRGRLFSAADTATSTPVAVINETAERYYFNGQSALGRTIRLDEFTMTVVGIVSGTRTAGPEGEVWEELYRPLSQVRVSGGGFLLKTRGGVESVSRAAVAAIREVRPDQVVEVQTLSGFLDVIGAQRRFTMQVLALFAVLGLVIAGAGVYGVMAYLVAQRIPEIGIRMALGAQAGQVLRSVLQRAGLYVSAGLAIGLAVAWSLSSIVEASLFGIHARDAVVYALVIAALALTGLVAAFIPARRAARVDPATTLR